MGRSINSFTSWVGTPHTVGGQNPDPETRLFTAVLSQAVHDAFSNHVDKLDKEAARNFLISNNKNLQTICEMAGRNSGYVCEKMRKKILRENGWNVDVSVDGHRKEYRGTHKGRKRGPKFKNNILTPP